MGSHRAEGSALRRHADHAPSASGRSRERSGRDRPGARRRAWARSLPQAGIIGALTVVTVVAPLAGDVLSNEPAAVAEASSGVSAGEPQLTRAHAPVRVSDFRVVPPLEPEEPSEPPPSLASAVAQSLPPEQLADLRGRAEQASRDFERSVLPDCDGQVSATEGANGRLDTDELCRLWDPDHLLRADAAVTLVRLNVDYENTFGEALCLTDSYRSYSAQARLRAIKPGLAAPAGASEHGWGLAVDLCGGVERAGDRYQWLRDNAPQYGWDNPDWARKGGSGPSEPWHWEYLVGQG